MERTFNPKVSVVMPTFNRSSYVQESAESVLSQSFRDLELIIIDDGSTDDTEESARALKDDRVVYLKNEKNLGIQKTLNRGIYKAKGEYIARIDDQDKWINKDKLKNQVEFLDSNKEYVLIGTGVIVEDSKGSELYRYLHPTSDKEIRGQILSRNCFTHSSVLFIKEAVVDLGGYNEEKNFKHVEDYDLWMNLGLVGKLKNFPHYDVIYIEDSGGISNKNQKEQIKKTLFLIKRYKDKYPGYLKAVLRYYLRLVVYGYLRLSFVSKITAFTSKKTYRDKKKI